MPSERGNVKTLVSIVEFRSHLISTIVYIGYKDSENQYDQEGKEVGSLSRTPFRVRDNLTWADTYACCVQKRFRRIP